MSKRGVFEMNVPGFIVVVIVAAGIGASAVYFMWSPTIPAPVETRIVYTGPAAQIFDTVKTQIASDKDGRLRMKRVAQTYTLGDVESGSTWRPKLVNGEVVGDAGVSQTAYYWPSKTLTDTVCYEPVECRGEK